MTSVLRRLVARATGDASANLRPRRPARFENGFDPVLQEVHHEVHVEQAAGAAPRVVADDSSPVSEHATRAAIPTDEAPRRMPRAAAAESRGSEHDVAVRRDVSAETPPGVLVEMLLEPLPPAPSPAPAPGPTTPSTAPAERRRPYAPAESRTRDRGREVETARPGPGDLRNTPEPLLRPVEARLADAAVPALDAPASAPPSSPHAARDESAAPEITIHIGQLEIRAASPAPAPQRRAAKPRNLPSLSEYLRGGRS